MTEIEKQNASPLNQFCKDSLITAGKMPDPSVLYILQLLRWAVLTNQHGLPLSSKLTDADVLWMVEKLMGIDPARAMEFLKPDAGDSFEACLAPEDLDGLTPEGAAAGLISILCSRMTRKIAIPYPGVNAGKSDAVPLDFRPPRRWTSDEDELLLAKYGKGESITDLAQSHARSAVSIRARLIRLGRVDPYRRGGYFGEYTPEFRGRERDCLAWTNYEQGFLRESYAVDSVTDIDRLAKIHRRHPLTISYWLARLGLRSESDVTVEEIDLENDIRPFELIDEFERTERKYSKQIGERFGLHCGLLSFKDAERLNVADSLNVGNYEEGYWLCEELPSRACRDWSEVGDDLDPADFEDYMGGPPDPDPESYPDESLRENSERDEDPLPARNPLEAPLSSEGDRPEPENYLDAGDFEDYIGAPDDPDSYPELPPASNDNDDSQS